MSNTGRQPVLIKHIILFDVAHSLPRDTALYGEGFQMLTQTGGTLGQPLDLGNYTDPKHYRLPEPSGARVVYGLATIKAAEGSHHVLAFDSCRRFNGALHVRPSSLQVIVETEGLTLEPGQQWTLEEFSYMSGPDREALLSSLAQRLNTNHPPLRFAAPPAGWCSWYCFGPRVTAQQVRDNLDVIAKQIPGLKYIQIDDGYQPAMGDWLETGPAFGGSVQAVLEGYPGAWIRAGDLGRSIHRRGRIEPLQGSSRVVREERRREAVAVRHGHVRRMAARPVVRRGRHAP